MDNLDEDAQKALKEAASAKGRRLTKNEKRRLLKKAKAEARRKAKASGAGDGASGQTAAASSTNSTAKTTSGESNSAGAPQNGSESGAGDGGGDDGVVVEYVSAEQSAALEGLDAASRDEFAAVFEKFASPEALTGALASGQDEDGDGEKGEGDEDDNKEDETPKIGRKKLKKMSRLSVAQLKQLVKRPDVVEVHDVTAADPRLLVALKCYRNTVPVPRHWCLKRKYLQGKRGIEKPPFQLPSFIEDTGIGKVRQALSDAEAEKSMKQQQRERVQPKMGKIELDYQVLHDAFFRFQKKPALTDFGDLYYEGKEFEVKLTSKKPGHLSQKLRDALGMGEGTPPPWLRSMQRYGPPPSYPGIKIPGLSAPIPEGANWGYHEGGWGQAPVDEYGNPLYGDVFGKAEGQDSKEGEEGDDEPWGAIAPSEDESEEESSAEEDAEEDEQEAMAEEAVDETAAAGTDGLETPLIDRLQAPTTTVELRKSGLDGESQAPKQLYQVLEQKATNVGADGIMGSSHTYVVPGAAGAAGAGGGAAADAGQLGNMDDDAVRAKYESGLASQVSGMGSEVSGARSEDTRKRKRQSEERKSKRAKEFKF